MVLSGELLAQAAVTGILLAGLYALLALGLNLAWGVMKIINVSHITFALIATYIAFFAFEDAGIEPLFSMLISVPVLFAMGVGVQSFLNKTRTALPVSSLLILFGLFVVIENLILLYWSADFLALNVPYRLTTYTVGSTILPATYVGTFVAGIGVVAAVYVLLEKTFFGKAVRATAEDPQTAAMLGVPIGSVTILTLGVASATAAVGGVFIGLIYSFYPSLGHLWLGRLFAIVVLGGMGSIGGTFVAAIIVALAESITGILYAPAWAPIVSYALLIIILLVRPQGVWARR